MSTQDLTKLKYFSGNEPKPETNKNHYRLYENTGCPFAERARLAFLAKNVPF